MEAFAHKGLEIAFPAADVNTEHEHAQPRVARDRVTNDINYKL